MGALEYITNNEIDDFANLVFEIEDTGIGMSQEFVNKIFNQFERDESQSVEKIEGNGIGMSITKGIADAMGATIQVQSKQGVGTKFTIYLRMKVDQNSREAIHKEKDGRQYCGKPKENDPDYDRKLDIHKRVKRK